MSHIAGKPPIYFPSGTLVDPNDVNENFLYLKKSLNEVSARRYEHVPLPLSFQSGTNGTMNKEMRSRRLPMLGTMLLERAYLYFNGTGSIQINLFQSSSPVGTDAAVAGITNPILSVSGSDPTVQMFDIFTTQLLFNSGSTYRFEITGTAANNWGALKADLILHLRADRAHTGSVYSFQDPALQLFTENDLLSATTFLANSGALSTAVQTNISNAQQAAKPMFFQFQNVSNLLDTSVLRMPIPVGNQSIERQTAIGLTFFMATTSSAQASQAYTVRLANPDNSTIISDNITLAQNQTGAYSEVRLSSDLTKAVAQASTDRTNDKQIVVSTAATLNLPLIYGYVWIK